MDRLDRKNLYLYPRYGNEPNTMRSDAMKGSDKTEFVFMGKY